MAVAEPASLARLTASMLGPGDRFATDAQLAAYAGVAPLETSSAELCATA
jgi:transposase